jgi:predicted transcriptional regulator
MAKPIPTLGYPTRAAAVVALDKEGKTIDEIAAAIGIKPKQVSNLLYEAKNSRNMRTNVRVYKSVLQALGPHASRRKLNSHALAERILKVVAESGLVDAVLDDLREQPRNGGYVSERVSA